MSVDQRLDESYSASDHHVLASPAKAKKLKLFSGVGLRAAPVRVRSCGSACYATGQALLQDRGSNLPQGTLNASTSRLTPLLSRSTAHLHTPAIATPLTDTPPPPLR